MKYLSWRVICAEWAYYTVLQSGREVTTTMENSKTKSLNYTKYYLGTKYLQIFLNQAVCIGNIGNIIAHIISQKTPVFLQQLKSILPRAQILKFWMKSDRNLRNFLLCFLKYEIKKD